MAVAEQQITLSEGSAETASPSSPAPVGADDEPARWWEEEVLPTEAYPDSQMDDILKMYYERLIALDRAKYGT